MTPQGEGVRYDHDIWDGILADIEDSLEAPIGDTGEQLQQMFLAVVTGGLAAAHALYDAYEPSLSIFGRLDDAAALPFAEVCCSAMVSRVADTVDTPEHREQIRGMLVSLLHEVLGVDEPRREAEAQLCDVQHVRDRETHSGQPGSGQSGERATPEELLLASIAARTLGATFGWKLASPPLPVESPGALRAAGWRPPLGLRLDEPAAEVAQAFAEGEVEMLLRMDEAGLLEWPSSRPAKGTRRRR